MERAARHVGAEQRCDGRRVHTARQKHADRDICHGPRSNRIKQGLPGLPNPRIVGQTSLFSLFKVIFAEWLDGDATRLPHQRRTRLQLLHTLDGGVGPRHILVGQIEFERRLRNAPRAARMGHQRAEFAPKPERTIRQVHVVERLFAEAVAGQPTAAVFRVPDRICEHAIELRGQPRAPGMGAMNKHLRVGGGLEQIALLFQLCS